MAEREVFYKKYADYTLDSDGTQTKEETAEMVISKLNQTPATN